MARVFRGSYLPQISNQYWLGYREVKIKSTKESEFLFIIWQFFGIDFIWKHWFQCIWKGLIIRVVFRIQMIIKLYMAMKPSQNFGLLISINYGLGWSCYFILKFDVAILDYHCFGWSNSLSWKLLRIKEVRLNNLKNPDDYLTIYSNEILSVFCRFLIQGCLLTEQIILFLNICHFHSEIYWTHLGNHMI